MLPLSKQLLLKPTKALLSRCPFSHLLELWRPACAASLPFPPWPGSCVAVSSAHLAAAASWVFCVSSSLGCPCAIRHAHALPSGPRSGENVAHFIPAAWKGSSPGEPLALSTGEERPPLGRGRRDEGDSDSDTLTDFTCLPPPLSVAVWGTDSLLLLADRSSPRLARRSMGLRWTVSPHCFRLASTLHSWTILDSIFGQYF